MIVTKPIDWLGGGVGARKQSYIEKRRLSFMYFIVDKMIVLLSARFMGDHIYTDVTGFLNDSGYIFVKFVLHCSPRLPCG